MIKTESAPFRTVALAGFTAALVLASLVLSPIGNRVAEGHVAKEPLFRVLVFSKTTGFRHDSIPAGIAAIRELGGRRTDFSYDREEDRLKHATNRLPYGRHTVRVVATDDAGNRAAETWSFRVVRP